MIIYKITNLINGKIYVGQTTVELEKRWKQHLKKNKKCIGVKNAILKHGAENFKIEEIDGANNLTELNYKEWLWVYKLNSLSPNGYNLKEGGGNRKLSEETKNKLRCLNQSKVIDKEVREKISKTMTGVVFSEKHRENISKSRKGFKISQITKDKVQRYWDNISQEERDIRNDNSALRAGGEQFDVFKIIEFTGSLRNGRYKIISSEFVGTYFSQRKCARELNISSKILYKCIKEGCHHKGYLFKKVEGN